MRACHANHQLLWLVSKMVMKTTRMMLILTSPKKINLKTRKKKKRRKKKMKLKIQSKLKMMMDKQGRKYLWSKYFAYAVFVLNLNQVKVMKSSNVIIVESLYTKVAMVISILLTTMTRVIQTHPPNLGSVSLVNLV